MNMRIGVFGTSTFALIGALSAFLPEVALAAISAPLQADAGSAIASVEEDTPETETVIVTARRRNEPQPNTNQRSRAIARHLHAQPTHA
jgi:hypothetical protein